MKINVTCISCQRIMRVASEHLGKKGKCPKCGTVNLIQEDSPLASNEPQQPYEVDALPVEEPLPVVEPLPVAEPIASYPHTQPPTNLSLGQSDFKTPIGSPYQSPNSSGPVRQNPSPVETDIPGILSVVAGGLSLLGLCLCMCFSPILIMVVIGSIGGIVLACFAKPPMKIIGLCLNGIALTITIVLIVVIVAFFIFAANSTPSPTFGPRFQGPGF